MIEPDQPTPGPQPKATLREMITDAIRYWEPRRILYNGALAVIVTAYFCIGLPQSRASLTVDGCLGLIVLAVLANLCYCAAYVPDIFAQFSGFQETWRKWRWLLFTVGVLFAGIITRFMAMAAFVTSHPG